MEVVHPRCAGMDISKNDAKVCLRVQDPGKPIQRTVTTYGATTREVQRLRMDLENAGVTQVVMEATGDYWKPFYFVLEDALPVELVNAKQARNIPGRKSDVSDAAWLADLAAHGLLRASFVPPEPVRQLRDLTRTRKHLVDERNREINRIDKVLQDAGIKLSSVASTLTTKSSRRILQAMVAGERDPRVLAGLVDPQMRKKEPELIEALTGRFREHHAFIIGIHLDRIDELDTHIARLEARVDEVIAPFRDARDALTTIPGISATVAAGIIGEIGIDMTVFETAGRLASWAGVSPGQNESAGRKGNAKTRPGDKNLKAYLGIAVLANARSRSTSIGARYRRIASRRGKQKAIVATERALLVIIWNMLRNGEAYQELGADYYHRHNNPDRLRNRALGDLRALGFEVTLTPAA